MSHGISSSSQENRSPDHPLPSVSTGVVNEQEMTFTLDTALKALEASQNEIGFLNDELSCISEQAEVDFRRLEDLRNVYENALEVQADTIYRLRYDLSSLQEDSQKQKASQNKIPKELGKLKDRNNTLQQRNDSLQKRNGSLQKLNGYLQKRNDSLQDRNHSKAELERESKARGQASLEDEAASNVGKRKRRHPSPETAFQQEPSKRRNVATVAETGAASMETSTGPGPWADFLGRDPPKYLPMPEQVTGFWKPPPEDIPTIPRDSKDQLQVEIEKEHVDAHIEPANVKRMPQDSPDHTALTYKWYRPNFTWGTR